MGLIGREDQKRMVRRCIGVGDEEIKDGEREREGEGELSAYIIYLRGA